MQNGDKYREYSKFDRPYSRGIPGPSQRIPAEGISTVEYISIREIGRYEEALIRSRFEMLWTAAIVVDKIRDCGSYNASSLWKKVSHGEQAYYIKASYGHEMGSLDFDDLDFGDRDWHEMGSINNGGWGDLSQHLPTEGISSLSVEPLQDDATDLSLSTELESSASISRRRTGGGLSRVTRTKSEVNFYASAGKMDQLRQSDLYNATSSWTRFSCGERQYYRQILRPSVCRKKGIRHELFHFSGSCTILTQIRPAEGVAKEVVAAVEDASFTEQFNEAEGFDLGVYNASSEWFAVSHGGRTVYRKLFDEEEALPGSEALTQWRPQEGTIPPSVFDSACGRDNDEIFAFRWDLAGQYDLGLANHESTWEGFTFHGSRFNSQAYYLRRPSPEEAADTFVWSQSKPAEGVRYEWKLHDKRIQHIIADEITGQGFLDHIYYGGFTKRLLLELLEQMGPSGQAEDWLREAPLVSEALKQAEEALLFEYQAAEFGPVIQKDIRADVLPASHWTDPPTEHMEACRPLRGCSECKGKILLVQRGKCDFYTKVSHAQAAGAVAVVIYDRYTGNGMITMTALDEESREVMIPAVFVTQETGLKILYALDNVGQTQDTMSTVELILPVFGKLQINTSNNGTDATGG